MADLHYKFGKYATAKTYYEKYIRFSEASPLTLMRYAFTLFNVKNLADAMDILNALRATNANDLQFLRLSGYIYFETAKYDSCIESLRTLIKNSAPNKRIV